MTQDNLQLHGLDYNQLVADYYQPLYRFAYSMARNPEDAADLTQQTFLIFADKGGSLKDASKVKSWLFTTLHREFLRLHRKSGRETQQEEEVLEAISEPVDAGVAQQVDAHQAMEVLQQIDETYRAPLTLFYIEDMAYKEIAETLDIPIGTVMSRLSRGKAQLKKQLLKKSGNK